MVDIVLAWLNGGSVCSLEHKRQFAQDVGGRSEAAATFFSHSESQCRGMRNRCSLSALSVIRWLTLLAWGSHQSSSSSNTFAACATNSFFMFSSKLLNKW